MQSEREEHSLKEAESHPGGSCGMTSTPACASGAGPGWRRTGREIDREGLLILARPRTEAEGAEEDRTEFVRDGRAPPAPDGPPRVDSHAPQGRTRRRCRRGSRPGRHRARLEGASAADRGAPGAVGAGAGPLTGEPGGDAGIGPGRCAAVGGGEGDPARTSWARAAASFGECGAMRMSSRACCPTPSRSANRGSVVMGWAAREEEGSRWRPGGGRSGS